MGTLNYTNGIYGTDTARTLMGTIVHASDAFTTSTTAANVENSGTDISTRAGDVFRCVASEAMWIRFGATAAVGTGFYLLADKDYEFEISPGDEGEVSVIDVA